MREQSLKVIIREQGKTEEKEWNPKDLSTLLSILADNPEEYNREKIYEVGNRFDNGEDILEIFYGVLEYDKTKEYWALYLVG